MGLRDGAPWFRGWSCFVRWRSVRCSLRKGVNGSHLHESALVRFPPMCEKWGKDLASPNSVCWFDTLKSTGISPNSGPFQVIPFTPFDEAQSTTKCSAALNPSLCLSYIGVFVLGRNQRKESEKKILCTLLPAEEGMSCMYDIYSWVFAPTYPMQLDHQ